MKANVAPPIVDVPRLHYEPRIPEQFVVAAVEPVIFSIGPISLPEVKTSPPNPSSENLSGSKERTNSRTNLDSLAELGAAPSPAARSPATDGEYKITYVSIQFRDEQQRAGAIQISKDLCKVGYVVPGIELVAKERSYPAAGGIRYYYAEQSAEAEQIAALIGPASAPLTTRRLAGFDGLPRNRIEIWLPAVQSANVQTADRNFSCKPGAPADKQALR
jgi:hypothetical protein